MSVPRRMWAMLLLAFVSCGCVQIDTRVRLNPDGSVTITERMRFSQGLLDLGEREKGGLNAAELLTRRAAEERLKHMGKVRLVSHTVSDAENGARESVAVFQADDLNDVRYASPFLAYVDYPENSLVRCELVPILKSKSSGQIGTAGELAVAFRPLKPPRSEPRPREGAPPPTGPSPRELQALRQLQPVFADLLRSFQVRLTFECYAPIAATGFGLRDRRANTNLVDLLHVTDRDLDRHGVNVLENEELVLDLLRGRFGSETVVETVRNFASNPSVPVFLSWGSSHAPYRTSDEIYFPPSRALFDRYLAGKTIDFDRGPSTGKKVRPARFEEVGWQPKPKSSDKEPK